jgi:DNA polymerase (family 10)
MAAASRNGWIAEQLRELAARLELDGIPHTPRAYRRAAETIAELKRPVADLYAEKGARGLEDLPGIGTHIAATLSELIDTGRLKRLDQLRRKAPVDVLGLLAVDGIGRQTLKALWSQLRVRTLEDLEEAIADGRVEALPGFGHKRAERLRQNLQIQRKGRERIPRERAAPIAERLCDALARHPSVLESSIAGSLRRGLSSVGDIDLVVASDDPSAVAACLLDRPEVEHVYSRGPHRVSVRLRSGIDLDLRTVPRVSYGSALLYFTGNRAHHVALRRLALAQGLRLNEYGLFRGHQKIAGATEAEIYEALSLPYLPPEERRGESEIRDALQSAAAS